jgi:hypothetical protein
VRARCPKNVRRFSAIALWREKTGHVLARTSGCENANDFNRKVGYVRSSELNLDGPNAAFAFAFLADGVTRPCPAPLPTLLELKRETARMYD